MLLNYLNVRTQEICHFAVCVCVCTCARKIHADLSDEPMFVTAVWGHYISKGALILVFTYSY